MSVRPTVLIPFLSVLAILAAACGDGTPTEPSEGFVGAWLGSLRQTSCTAGDPRTCAETFPNTAAFTLRLDLEEDDAEVRATFDLNTVPPQGALAPQRREVGLLLGSIDNGTLILEGSVLQSGTAMTGAITRWRSRIESDGSMTGSFTYTAPGGAGLNPLVVEFDLSGLRRAG